MSSMKINYQPQKKDFIRIQKLKYIFHLNCYTLVNKKFLAVLKYTNQNLKNKLSS